MAKNNLQVEVNEATANETRTITITITGAAEDFLLADLLAQRKAIPAGAAALRNAVLEGAKNWLESAEQVVAGARSEQKIADDIPPKRVRKSKEPYSPNDVPTRRVKPEAVNSTVAATSFSGD